MALLSQCVGAVGEETDQLDCGAAQLLSKHGLHQVMLLTCGWLVPRDAPQVTAIDHCQQHVNSTTLVVLPAAPMAEVGIPSRRRLVSQ